MRCSALRPAPRRTMRGPRRRRVSPSSASSRPTCWRRSPARWPTSRCWTRPRPASAASISHRATDPGVIRRIPMLFSDGERIYPGACRRGAARGAGPEGHRRARHRRERRDGQRPRGAARHADRRLPGAAHRRRRGMALLRSRQAGALCVGQGPARSGKRSAGAAAHRRIDRAGRHVRCRPCRFARHAARTNRCPALRCMRS